ncbi:peptidyl-tRNA hydrolase, mitochondrial-like [Bidens hawaiensis]|uniref:peptidyl-tRNA hydrolase, mitochondrial-like n=1 Tax=Bidens hawaiensis TaxID=980011 RepID=UPI004049832F
MNITTGILSSPSLPSPSSTFNRCRRLFLSSYYYKTNIQSYYYKTTISMHSSSSSSSSSSAAAALNPGASASGTVSPKEDNNNINNIINKPPKQYPWLIVGLGNPGKLYNRTRHNVGFEMVDAIAEAEGICMSSVSFKAFFGKGCIGNTPLILAKPQTFMNASGESVGAIVSFYKIPPMQVLLIYDDLDLPFGKLRLLPKGGHGGHNGMKSVINHLKGTFDFPRLRIGIGRPPGKMEAASYVLRRFNKQESEELDFTFQTGIEAIRILLLQGFDKSATFVNSLKPVKQIQ